MLETRSLYVKGIDQDDLPHLYRWRNEATFRDTCTVRKHCVTAAEFEHEFLRDLAGDKHVQFIAYRKRDKAPIGTIWAYKLDMAHGYVYVTIYLDETARRRGYGAEMMAAMLYHLFDSMPWLHKVYTEVYGDNTFSLKTLLGAGFQIEGTLKGHFKKGEARIDHHWLAMYRDYWEADPHNIVPRLLPGYADTLRHPV